MPDFPRVTEICSGIVFDFNGTLFWDTQFHNLAWIEYCSKFGITLTSEELFRKFHGKPNDRILTELFEGRLTPNEIQKASNEKEDIYQKICLQEKLPLAPGVERLLEKLKEIDFPFTIATASMQRNVDFYFQHLNLGRWVDYDKYIFHDGTLPGKPDPTVYLRAMAKIGLTPDQTLVFEDAPSGIQAAVNAHAAQIILVNSDDEDYSMYPYRVIRSFDEIEV